MVNSLKKIILNLFNIIKAADLGNEYALCNLGNLYEQGYGIEKNYYKAFECYKKAADLGDSTSVSNIGELYYKGRGVQQN